MAHQLQKRGGICLEVGGGMSVEITIDPEFQSLIQPLAANELELLTEQIRTHGCLEPLCVWKTNGQRILLDGHNRYAICTKIQRAFNTVNVTLASREHAKLWILEHQTGRRNLTDDQRAVIWNEIREQRSKVASFEGAAKARAAKSDSANSTESERAKKDTSSKSERPKKDTRKETAEESGLPESKLRKVQWLKNTDSELYEAVRVRKVKLREVSKLLQLKKTNLQVYEAILAGTIKLRDVSKPLKRVAVPPKDLRKRYSEPDFYRRVGTALAGAFAQSKDRLDELTHIKKCDWSPEAAEGVGNVICNLEDVARRANDYAGKFRKLVKLNTRKAA
jgi:hypothetical protein